MKLSWARKSPEQELDDELRAHLEMSAQDRVHRGASQDEAQEAARREFGNLSLIRSVTRDQWAWAWLDNLAQDFRYAARSLRKNPEFTAVAVLTLALGIGANTAIFSVVDAVVLRPLPFPDATHLVDLCARSTLFDFTHLGVSLPDLDDVRKSSTTLAAISPYQYASHEIVADGKPDRIESADISEDFFPLLGIQPLYGRSFTAAEMLPGAHVVILGNRLWRQRFAEDPAAIGKSILLDDQSTTVIGVMPDLPQLDFATDAQLWTPFAPTAELTAARQTHGTSVLAVLKPHATVEQAQRELDTISAHLAASYPNADKDWSLHLTSLRPFLLGDVSTPLLVLFGAVGFVLLIACANVSNLFLSRGWARRREFAIRSAIGATRGALLRQQLVEGLLIALIGGACAFLIALWSMSSLRGMLPQDMPRLGSIRVESSVGVFAFAVSVLAALLSGLAPALLSTRDNFGLAIKESTAGSGTRACGNNHHFLRQFLVVAEVALAVILVIGATLVLQSFARLLGNDPGFRADHLVTMRIEFPKFRFVKLEQATDFVQQVLANTRAVPGVRSVSAGLVFPLGDFVSEAKFQTEQSEKEPSSEDQMVRDNQVSPDFFRTLGLPLLAGRDFSSADIRTAPRVFIVNEAFARKVFGTIDVLGKRLSDDKESGRDIWGEIVGITGNIREARAGDEPVKPQIYTPFSQARKADGIFLVVRTQFDPLAVVSALQDRIWTLDKNRPVSAIKTMDKQIAENNATPKSQGVLLGIFGALGFVLALIGVYGVMSYIVSQQTREIGIRMALGAAPDQVLNLVICHGLKLTLAGVAIGLAIAFALTRFIASLLFGISPTDPLTFATVAVSLILIATAACAIPARRAMTVDPMVALRHD